MYNPFTFVKLIPSYGYGHVIQWGIDPVFGESDPHIFTVQVSGTPDFSELLYEIAVNNAFSALDDKNVKQSFTMDLFYRVKLDTGSNNTYYSKNVNFSGARYGRREYVQAREIIRKELLRMRKYTGGQAFLLKRKIHGIQLNDPTVDPITGVPLTDQHTGQGSHFAVGYYTPLAFYVSFEDDQKSRKQGPEGLGLTDITQQNFRTIGFPIVETYDVIVEPLNDQRYLVKQKEEHYFPGTDLILVQILETQLIPNTDPVYKIEVPKI